MFIGLPVSVLVIKSFRILVMLRIRRSEIAFPSVYYLRIRLGTMKKNLLKMPHVTPWTKMKTESTGIRVSIKEVLIDAIKCRKWDLLPGIINQNQEEKI